MHQELKKLYLSRPTGTLQQPCYVVLFIMSLWIFGDGVLPYEMFNFLASRDVGPTLTCGYWSVHLDYSGEPLNTSC